MSLDDPLNVYLLQRGPERQITSDMQDTAFYHHESLAKEDGSGPKEAL